MRILQVSWEYPPLVYGGLGRHVHALCEAQAAAGHEVTVLTARAPGSPARETVAGVRIVRVPAPTPAVPTVPDALVDWVHGLDAAMAASGISLAGEISPQVVHAHDWVVARAATSIRSASGLPLVVTVHATEAGRHQGWITTDLSRRIHRIEYRLTNEAQRVITCSQAMRAEVGRLFGLPAERCDVITNGIDLRQWTRSSPEAAAAARQRWAAPGRPLVVFVGRLEWEKGVHTLLEAASALSAAVPGIRIVIAGTGTRSQHLRDQAVSLNLDQTVTFTGWIPEEGLRALTTCADAVVVPSLYEPFGLVALEAAALRVPLVVAATGGLTEIVRDGETGRVFPPGDPAALAAALTDVVTDPGSAALRAEAAYRELRLDYDWNSIAAATVAVYRRAVAESEADPRPFDPPAPDIPIANLFAP